MTSRKIAHYHATDLVRAIIEQDTCCDPLLAAHRARQLDKAFRQIAADLGYAVEPVAADQEQAA